MKTLILVRHAESSSPNKIIEDYERPLKKTGVLDAEKIGQHLKTNKYIPDYILTSGAQRALETAQIISEQLFDKPVVINNNKLIYGASVKDIINLIKSFDENYHTIMIVGHNPTITLSINKITNVNIDHVPTLGTAMIKYDINRWENLKEVGELVEFIYPKKLNLI